MSNCVIIDANAIVHSAYHAMEPKLDKKGEDQRVLYGLISSLVDLTYKIDNISELYLVFDPEDGYVYRKSQFSRYKENRPPQDPNIKIQKDKAIFIIEEYLGLNKIIHNGYEADDAIGTLSKLKEKESKVIIVSPDKDLIQLVTPNVSLLKKIRRKNEKGYELINYENVKEKFGLYPNQIPDWIALMGDSIDNLPGLNGVGNKTAINILNQYISVDHLFAICHELENKKLKEQIIENKDIITLTKKLATIKTDLSLEKDLSLTYEKSEKVRFSDKYNQNLMNLQKYFNWPVHFMDIFL